MLAIQFCGSRHECQHAGVLALGGPHIEQLTAFILRPLNTGLQFVGHEIRIAGFQTLAQARDASIQLLNLVRQRLGSRGELPDSIGIGNTHFRRHSLHSLGCQQVATDAAENNPLDGIPAHADMVRTGSAVPMTATRIAASIRNDVVGLANIADEQTAQQVPRPAAALEPFVAVGGNARADLRSFKQRI